MTRDRTLPRKPVALLHGFMGHPRDWQPLIAALPGSIAAHALAIPGHAGRASLPPEATFYSACAALLPEMERVGSGAAPALLGYSMGGRVALYLALQHPDCCSALVLESATPGLRDADARAARVEHDAALARELRACTDSAAFRAFLENWYSQPPFDSLDAEQRACLVEARLDNDPAALADALGAYSVGRQPDLWPLLPTLQCPTLVICGENDHKFRRTAEEMAAVSPQIAVYVMANCGHNVHLEQPAAYTIVLRGFLEGAG